MKREELQQLIADSLTDRLEPSRQEDLESLLQKDKKAKLELRAFESSWEMLDSWQMNVEPDAAYVERFWSHRKEDRPQIQRVSEQVRGIFSNKKLIPVYIGAVILLFVSLVTFRTTYQVHSIESMLTQLSFEEIQIIEHMELLEDWDVIMNLDFLQSLQVKQE